MMFRITKIKSCKTCNKEFNLKTYNQKYCSKECFNYSRKYNSDRMSYQISYVTNKRKETKQKAVDYLGGKCIKCGYDKCVAALDFHHRNSDKKDTNIAALHRTWEKIRIELDKCDLVCSNCHREIHYYKTHEDTWQSLD